MKRMSGDTINDVCMWSQENIYIFYIFIFIRTMVCMWKGNNIKYTFLKPKYVYASYKIMFVFLQALLGGNEKQNIYFKKS